MQIRGHLLSSVRWRAAVAAGRIAGRLSQFARLGAGETIAGRVTLAVAPDAMERLAHGRRVVLVTGTNGKTTTTRMVGAALRQRVCTNVTGANLASGIVSALLHDASDTAVLEVDELLLAEAIRRTHPAVVVLLNLSRDQLDRMHDLRRVVRTWSAALQATGAVAVANADDPLVVESVGAHSDVTWVHAGLDWDADIGACGRCGGPLRIDGHGWSCTSCDARQPRCDVRSCRRGLEIAGNRYPIHLALPGRMNEANAAFAVAAAMRLGIAVDTAIARLEGITEIEGRYARFRAGGRDARLMLAKNPAGWSSALRLAHPDAAVVIAMNARTADGFDTSWLWDVPFESLAGHAVGVTGERSADVLLRLQYAGVPALELHGLDDVDRVAGASVDVMGNYTAFTAIRQKYVSRR